MMSSPLLYWFPANDFHVAEKLIIKSQECLRVYGSSTHIHRFELLLEGIKLFLRLVVVTFGKIWSLQPTPIS